LLKVHYQEILAQLIILNVLILCEQIVVNLLQVFVSIEMTGQSVQFEQKFNYRRPMYIVMDYLWQIVEHRNNFM
jgi:hypothetical protein